jgi:hypothetical protein
MVAPVGRNGSGNRVAVAWLLLSGRVAYLTLDRRVKVEINGIAVDGEILSNRNGAIVTRRAADKKHSDQLFFEGDIDRTGNTGSVLQLVRTLG